MTPILSPKRLILASNSPYRRQLLERLQLPFEVIPANVDEGLIIGESPSETALRLAITKATALTTQLQLSSALIIGSDQVAELEGAPLNKPLSHASALAQLKSMQGKKVLFHTALAVLDSGTNRLESHIESSIVTYKNLPENALDRYLKLDKPYDCTGSSKIESLGIALVASVQSLDPTALIGLPLIALTSLLRQFGVDALAI